MALTTNLDNVRRMTAALTFCMKGMDNPVFHCPDRMFHKSALIERVCVDHHLHIHRICNGKTIINRGSAPQRRLPNDLSLSWCIASPILIWCLT